MSWAFLGNRLGSTQAEKGGAKHFYTMMNIYLNFTDATYAHLDLYHLVAATVGWVASEPAGSVHSMWSYSGPNRDNKRLKAVSLCGVMSLPG